MSVDTPDAFDPLDFETGMAGRVREPAGVPTPFGARLVPRGVLVGVGVVFGAFAVLFLFMRPEPQSVLAPLLGPMAGLLYGHSDCTMANQMPGVSIGVGVFGLALVGLVLAPLRAGRGLRVLMAVLATTWAFLWAALATLSVVNTLS